MLHLRRPTYPVRVEMTPLIDVIFLLLTFFIYSLVVTVQAQVMPVTLTPVAGTHAQGGQSGQIDAITIGRDGQFFFNQTPIAASDLSGQLARFAAKPGQHRLFIAMEAKGDTDRGPLLINLIQQLRHAGITDFAIVGQPSAQEPSQGVTPSTLVPVPSPSTAPNDTAVRHGP